MNKCLNCDLELSSFRKKYCTNQCQRKYEHKEYIKNWKSGLLKGGSIWKTSPYIRKYLFEKYNNMCAGCGWGAVNVYTGNIPLEVEHLDGNWENNDEKNLVLICPNCHSLSKTYRALNKGKGRYTNLKKMGFKVFGKQNCI